MSLNISQEIITRHKAVTARFLNANYDLFFAKYNFELMKSNSYVTKRQSIKLLGELLLDRSNYNIMITYVADGEHLKLCMNLMRDDRRMVRYEAFHVFKVSRANDLRSHEAR
jgi:calcium binding protein 39